MLTLLQITWKIIETRDSHVRQKGKRTTFHFNEFFAFFLTLLQTKFSFENNNTRK